ncbi:AEC family transporter [Candidatus Uhrbacteria bacterium]|nr:AEC family transporter [Candidatus Uhrbacteria bacterium]
MIVFFTLISKILPLYAIIVLGFVAARKLGAQKETLASLLIYTIAPVVVFYGVLTAPLTLAYFSLPLIFFAIASILCGIFFVLGKTFYQDDPTKNILAFSAGAANVGYFGLPMVLVLFGNGALSIAVLCITGIILYENTVGFYVTARGHHTVAQSIGRVVRLPTVYAFLLGALFNFFRIPLGPDIVAAIGYFKGAYTLLGMMIVGMGLATVRWASVDMRFITLAFLAKFVAWPLLITLVILLDKLVIHAYTQEIFNVMMLLSVVPLAANAVAFATELKVHPEKTAIAVFLSTLFALVYIPIIARVFIR